MRLQIFLTSYVSSIAKYFYYILEHTVGIGGLLLPLALESCCKKYAGIGGKLQIGYSRAAEEQCLNVFICKKKIVLGGPTARCYAVHLAVLQPCHSSA